MPESPYFYQLQACSHTVLAATARNICAQSGANSHVFIYCEQSKRYIQKSVKSLPAAYGHMNAACSFCSLWLPNFSAFKNVSQNPIKHGLTYQVFFSIKTKNQTRFTWKAKFDDNFNKR